MDEGYSRRVRIEAAAQTVFRSVATLEGLKGWWTSLVSGSPREGGTLRFKFKGLSEHIDMQVKESAEPSRVVWICLVHSSLPEWSGTRVEYVIETIGADSCTLQIRHVGLVPDLECYEDCSLGWDHFLGSIAQYAETGRGNPFGGTGRG